MQETVKVHLFDSEVGNNKWNVVATVGGQWNDFDMLWDSFEFQL